MAAHSSAGAGSVHVPRACERDEPNKRHEVVCRSHAPRVADFITWRGCKLFGFDKLKRLGANEKYRLSCARQRGSKCRNGPTRFPFPAALYPRHVSARCVRRRIGHSFMGRFDGECTQHPKVVIGAHTPCVDAHQNTTFPPHHSSSSEIRTADLPSLHVR